MLKLPGLLRLVAVLGLWLLACAPAFATGGADCLGHGAASKSHQTAAYASHSPDAHGLSAFAVNALRHQGGLGPTSGSVEPPALTDADQACGSCVHCAACCFSVAPPMSLQLPAVLASQGTVFPSLEHHHPSTDLATLERPPQPAHLRKTA